MKDHAAIIQHCAISIAADFDAFLLENTGYALWSNYYGCDTISYYAHSQHAYFWSSQIWQSLT